MTCDGRRVATSGRGGGRLTRLSIIYICPRRGIERPGLLVWKCSRRGCAVAVSAQHGSYWRVRQGLSSRGTPCSEVGRAGRGRGNRVVWGGAQRQPLDSLKMDAKCVSPGERTHFPLAGVKKTACIRIR